MKQDETYVHYLTISPELEHAHLFCTTCGHQTILPNEPYPPIGRHPEGYYFRKGYGRRLPEYQIVYITAGAGQFQSEHINITPVRKGTAILIFPNEWHYYEPLSDVGWNEYWVGFRGDGVHDYIKAMRLSPENPLIQVRDGVHFFSLFHEIINSAEHELTGYQMLCAGATLHMLCILSFNLYHHTNTNQNITDTISKAQTLMRQYVGKNVPCEQIAEEIGVGYSWFRQTFKQHVGTSPLQYQQQLRIQRAEFLLSNPNLSIADIAYTLGFANPNQFSTFFRQHKHVSPLAFRRSIGMLEHSTLNPQV